MLLCVSMVVLIARSQSVGNANFRVTAQIKKVRILDWEPEPKWLGKGANGIRDCGSSYQRQSVFKMNQ